MYTYISQFNPLFVITVSLGFVHKFNVIRIKTSAINRH